MLADSEGVFFPLDPEMTDLNENVLLSLIYLGGDGCWEVEST